MGEIKSEIPIEQSVEGAAEVVSAAVDASEAVITDEAEAVEESAVEKRARENAEQDAEFAAMAKECELKAAQKKAQEAAPENAKESALEVERYNELVAAFEREHSLEALLEIEDLTPEDAPNHPVREPARLALKAVVAQRKLLKDRTDISLEDLTVIDEDYRRLSRAVGMISRGKVDHTR